jgi:hypothetical protein
MSYDRLHARGRISSSRGFARITTLESIYDSDSHPAGNVITDAAAGCAAQEKTFASAVDGNRVVERPSDGVGCKIHFRSGVLVANELRTLNYKLNEWWGWGESNSRPAV